MSITPASLEEAFGALAIQNNGGNDYCHQRDRRVYTEPTNWFVVDRTTAEPEVNWPGELVSMHDNHEAAVRAFWTEVLARASRGSENTSISQREPDDAGASNSATLGA